MSDEFKFQLPNGQTVRTGNIVPDTRPLSFAEYPESDLYSLDECIEILSNPARVPARQRRSHQRITNQGARSSCNAYAAVRALEKARANTGQPEVELGPEYLYAHINGGRDRGSMLDDGMKALTDLGCPTRDMVPYQAFKLDDVKSIEADRIARNYRAFECYTLPTSSPDRLWQAAITAVCRGEPVVLAVHVGRNFMRSRDTAGIDRGPGNHAVHADDAKFRKGRPANFRDIMLDHAGSWGTSFGDGGRALLYIDHIAETMRWHSIYAIRSAVVDPDAASPTLKP